VATTTNPVILRRAKRSRRIHPGQAVTNVAYVYILASQKRGAHYTGVTSNLQQRLHQHRRHQVPGFTSRYQVTRLVWFVQGEDILAAIALEKKIKNRGRQWKIDLIETANPDWDDLAAGWMNAGSCDFARDDPSKEIAP
jgi:putative endonuclease